MSDNDSSANPNPLRLYNDNSTELQASPVDTNDDEMDANVDFENQNQASISPEQFQNAKDEFVNVSYN